MKSSRNKNTFVKYISVVSKNWRDPFFWKATVPTWMIAHFYKLFVPNRGIYVMEEDWDNLIILDACRYDTFKDVTGMEPNPRISRASTTDEFIEENFIGKRFDDTVVVTGNPKLDQHVRGCFYRIIPVWKDGWDRDINTVLPQTMLKYALQAERSYPNKRLIIWFIQPHEPFLEDAGISIDFNKWLWRRVDKGYLSLERVCKGYRRNLEIALPYAFELARKLKGKTVITADHGESFKMFRFPLPVNIVGHPSNVHITSLVRVPWLVFESGERKEIKAESEEEKVKGKIGRLKSSGRV